MKGKFVIDLVFVVLVSVLSSYLTFEFVMKPNFASQIPKIAVLSLDREFDVQSLEENAENFQKLAVELKARGDELAKQGFIVVDSTSVVSVPEQYRAN